MKEPNKFGNRVAPAQAKAETIIFFQRKIVNKNKIKIYAYASEPLRMIKEKREPKENTK